MSTPQNERSATMRTVETRGLENELAALGVSDSHKGILGTRTSGAPRRTWLLCKWWFGKENDAGARGTRRMVAWKVD